MISRMSNACKLNVSVPRNDSELSYLNYSSRLGAKWIKSKTEEKFSKPLKLLHL